jgi:hypothetical protein
MEAAHMSPGPAGLPCSGGRTSFLGQIFIQFLAVDLAHVIPWSKAHIWDGFLTRRPAKFE